ncbi:MAG: hypothetical protein PHQ04_07285 [Opitutaceae bacterium]|nr:hypothetical protein [Opitutaceae bacterium]
MRSAIALAWLALLLCAIPARAVVVAGVNGTGTNNTTDPGLGFGFGNVGIIGGATGIYLGSYGGGYWVLTANHVGMGNIALCGTTFNAVAGSGRQIGSADLYVFRIDANPGLPTLTLATSSPVLGTPIYMVGGGQQRSAATQWTITKLLGDNDDIWTTPPSEEVVNAEGYTFPGGNVLRWGSNNVELLDQSFSATACFATFFSRPADFNTSNEAQGSAGDSGGAVFFQSSGTWCLGGVMLAVSGLDGMAGTTAAIYDYDDLGYGNATLDADIATYRGAILSVIPEPTETGMMMGGMGAIFAFGWRRYRQKNSRAG